MPNRLVSLLGIVVILAVAALVSRDRGAIRWKNVVAGVALQFIFAVSILGIPAYGIPGVFRFVFDGLNYVMTSLVGFTSVGSQFVFGPLAEAKEPWGFVFAFRALPPIIFFSALMSGLYYMGILQRVVKGFAWIMQKTLGTSGAETLSGAANIFMGQTEAPLLVRPFIDSMTRSEMFCVMVGGMATIASGVEGAYIGLLHGRVSDIAGHLLTASTMGAVGGLIISKMIFPETEKPLTADSVNLPKTEKIDCNLVEAFARGATDGVLMAVNVGAMLVAFITLITLLDAILRHVGLWLHFSEPLNFALVLGTICQPFAWLLGVPWSESAEVGRVIGEKVIMNEFVAYVHLSQVGATLSDRTVLIASYALCGFANISSIGIQIGGIGAMAPTQKSQIAKLGFYAVLGGNLACGLSACIAGLIF